MAEPETVARRVTLSKDEQEYVYAPLQPLSHCSKTPQGPYATPPDASLHRPYSH